MSKLIVKKRNNQGTSSSRRMRSDGLLLELYMVRIKNLI